MTCPRPGSAVPLQAAGTSGCRVFDAMGGASGPETAVGVCCQSGCVGEKRSEQLVRNVDYKSALQVF
jgi:hypothetical protein